MYAFISSFSLIKYFPNDFFYLNRLFSLHTTVKCLSTSRPRVQFRNNCHTDAIVVSCTNVFTAIFAGYAVFAIMGFLAHNLHVPVSEVVQSGPGLAFIAYPEAVLLMPMPRIWAILFFFMMLILGMGSQFGGIEAICTAIIDQWPHLREHHWKVLIPVITTHTK